MEGPRAVRKTELSSLAQLVDTVFMHGQQGAMFRSYPSLFNHDNLDNCLVFTDRDRVISHVGMIQRWACLDGCTVRVACIGSVSTYEECRGRGYATRLFAAACDKAFADGVDVMMISGGRGIYRRAGAADVGCDYTAIMNRDAARQLEMGGVRAAEFSDGDLPHYIAAYGKRPARFLRPADDWRWLAERRTCMCQDVRMFTVLKDRTPCAYFIIGRTNDEGACSAIEFAGDDVYCAAALGPIMDLCGAKTIKLRLQRSDHMLKALCETVDVAFQPTPATGTWLLINCPQLMHRLRPFVEARIGLDAAKTAAFETHNARCIFRVGDNTLALDKANAAQLVFGHPTATRATGLMGALFPVPTLCYGINYV